ncbi:MAG TPA: hypothetical protein VIM41_11925 [Gammaproteobacteria bacterium]
MDEVCVFGAVNHFEHGKYFIVYWMKTTWPLKALGRLKMHASGKTYDAGFVDCKIATGLSLSTCISFFEAIRLLFNRRVGLTARLSHA